MALAGATVLGYNGDCDTCYSALELASYRLVVAGIGAGVGALLDLVVRDRRVLYKADTRTSTDDDWSRPDPEAPWTTTSKQAGLMFVSGQPETASDLATHHARSTELEMELPRAVSDAIRQYSVASGARDREPA